MDDTSIITAPDMRRAQRPRRRAFVAAVVVLGLLGFAA
jgi:hypothetical protein